MYSFAEKNHNACCERQSHKRLSVTKKHVFYMHVAKNAVYLKQQLRQSLYKDGTLQ